MISACERVTSHPWKELLENSYLWAKSGFLLSSESHAYEAQWPVLITNILYCSFTSCYKVIDNLTYIHPNLKKKIKSVKEKIKVESFLKRKVIELSQYKNTHIHWPWKSKGRGHMYCVSDSCKWRLIGLYFLDSSNTTGSVTLSEWFTEMVTSLAKVLNKTK